MANTCDRPRMMSIDPATAGVAISDSFMSLRATSSNVCPAFTTNTSPSSLAR